LTLGEIDRGHAERLRAIERETSVALSLVVPPLLVDIIGDATDREGLLKVALQRREAYRDLRRWLAYFQQAIRDGDVERMMEYQATIKRCVDLATSTEYAGVHRYSVVSRIIDEMPGQHRRAALIMDKLLLRARRRGDYDEAAPVLRRRRDQPRGPGGTVPPRERSLSLRTSYAPARRIMRPPPVGHWHAASSLQTPMALSSVPRDA